PATFYRTGPRRPPPKPPPRNGLRGRSPRSNRNTHRSAVRSPTGYLPATWECSTSERRLCRRNESWGEVSEGGRSPPPNVGGVGALGRTLNVQRVRLACGPRAPPCSWTLLIALARAFLRQAPSVTRGNSDGGSAPLYLRAYRCLCLFRTR